MGPVSQVGSMAGQLGGGGQLASLPQQAFQPMMSLLSGGGLGGSLNPAEALSAASTADWLSATPAAGGPVAAKPEPASQASPTTRPARFTSRLTGPQTVTRIEQNRSPVPQLTASDQLAREIDPTLMPPAMLKDLPPGFRPVIYYAPDQR